jgi:hypothetical protein
MATKKRMTKGGRRQHNSRRRITKKRITKIGKKGNNSRK